MCDNNANETSYCESIAILSFPRRLVIYSLFRFVLGTEEKTSVTVLPEIEPHKGVESKVEYWTDIVKIWNISHSLGAFI